jgi:hypothetical protein
LKFGLLFILALYLGCTRVRRSGLAAAPVAPVPLPVRAAKA